jgi:hypothetical protein
MEVFQNNVFPFKFSYVINLVSELFDCKSCLILQSAQPRSVVDGTPLPPNVVQEGSDLVFRNPAVNQAGNYICTVTHPDGSIERIAVYLEYRPGSLIYLDLTMADS